MIDLDERFAQAWGEEPLLPDPTERLVAGKRRLRRRRVATSTLGSVGAVVLAVAVSSLVGGGAQRSAPPDFATSSPSASGSSATANEFPVRDPRGYTDTAMWANDDGIFRASSDIEVLRSDDSRPVLDARSGTRVGSETVVESRSSGRVSVQYFDFADGRYRGGGGGEASYDSLLARDSGPLFYDSGPGWFELFDSPVGVDDSSELTAKTGATIESQRRARTGEFSTARFDASHSPPSVGVATIAGLRYYAIAGYTAAGKDVIVAQQVDGRSLEQFLSEVKAGMDDGSIVG